MDLWVTDRCVGTLALGFYVAATVLGWKELAVSTYVHSNFLEWNWYACWVLTMCVGDFVYNALGFQVWQKVTTLCAEFQESWLNSPSEITLPIPNNVCNALSFIIILPFPKELRVSYGFLSVPFRLTTIQEVGYAGGREQLRGWSGIWIMSFPSPNPTL